MNDNWRFTTKSITKYDPLFRDKDGRYTKEDWMSFSQVGQIVDGHPLSLDSYLSIEEKYIKAGILFFQFHNCHRIIIKNFEKYDFESYNLNDKKELLKYYDSAFEGTVIPIDDLSFFVKLVLRELIWAEFYCENSQGIALRFGHDYYMYFNSNDNMDILFDDVNRLGLFVD